MICYLVNNRGMCVCVGTCVCICVCEIATHRVALTYTLITMKLDI